MKHIIIKTLVLVGVGSLVILGGATIASAQDTLNATDNSNSVTKTSKTDRLDAAKLKACQNIETKINNTMSRVANRAQKRQMLFDGIVDKVKALYVEKALSIENYDELIANIAKARATVQNMITTEHTMTAQFSCDGDNPKSSLNAFKNQQKTELQSLKDYRSAIKDLISAIKTEILANKDGEL